MVKGETVTVYDWFDIQNEICDVMGIPSDKFRDYHEIVGGDYKDLWHIALRWVVPDHMANDTIVTMWLVDDIDWIMREGRGGAEWARPFFEAYNTVMKDLDPNDKGVLVRFSW